MRRPRNEILVSLLVGALMLLVATASANVASLLLARAAAAPEGSRHSPVGRRKPVEAFAGCSSLSSCSGPVLRLA